MVSPACRSKPAYFKNPGTFVLRQRYNQQKTAAITPCFVHCSESSKREKQALISQASRHKLASREKKKPQRHQARFPVDMLPLFVVPRSTTSVSLEKIQREKPYRPFNQQRPGGTSTRTNSREKKHEHTHTRTIQTQYLNPASYFLCFVPFAGLLIFLKKRTKSRK